MLRIRLRRSLLAGCLLAALGVSGCAGEGGALEELSDLPTQPRAAVAADFDGDGVRDLVLGYGAGEYFGLTHASQDAYGFWSSQALDAFVAGGSDLLAVTDVSGDGVPDLIASARGLDRVHVLRNRGDGTFAAPEAEVIAPLSPPGSTRVTALTSAVAPDGDTRLVAVAFETDDPNALTRPRNVVTYYATDGGLEPANPAQLFDPYDGPGDPREIELLDVDGDDRLDLVIGTADARIQIYRGLADTHSAFSPTPITLTVPGVDAPVTALAVGDVRTAPTAGGWAPDGVPDVLAAFGTAQVHGWKGLGSGAFAPSRVVGDGLYPQAPFMTLAIDEHSNWGALTRNLLSVATQTADGFSHAPVSAGCSPVTATLFPGDHASAPFAAAFTCTAESTADALVAVPSRRRLRVPPSVAFGARRAGTSSAASAVTLRAADSRLVGGQATGGVEIGDVTITGPDADEFSVSRVPGTCVGSSVPLPPACTPSVRFSPRTPGEKHATMVITSDAYRASGALPHRVALSGTGSGALAAAPASVAIGDVPLGDAETVTISVANHGNEPLSIDQLNVDGDPAGFSADRGSCTSAVAPGTSCDATVTFAPTVRGAATATVRVVSNTTGEAPVVAVAARGVSSGVTAAPLAFGSVTVGSTTSRAVTLENSGDHPLTVTAIDVTGDDAGSLVVDAAPCTAGPIPPGETCTATVDLTPTARGPLDAALAVRSNAPASPNVVAVQALATQGAPTTPVDVSVDPIRIGSFAEVDVAVANDGDAPLAIASIAAEGPGTVVDDGCTDAPLAEEASCSVTVRVTPTVVGPFAVRLRVVHDGEGPPRTVALTGTALPAAIPPPTGPDTPPRNPVPDDGATDRGPGVPAGDGGDRPRSATPPNRSATPAPRLRLRVAGPARRSVRRGNAVLLRVAVSNRGTRVAPAGRVRFRLPSSLRRIAPRGRAGSVPRGSRTVRVAVGRLAPGARRTVTLRVRVAERARRGPASIAIRATSGAASARAVARLLIR